MVSNYRYFLRVSKVSILDTFVSIDDFDTFSIVSPITKNNYFLVSVFGWPDPNTCMGMLLELKKSVQNHLPSASFPHVWIRPSKH